MKYDKSYLRKRSLIQRKKKYLNTNKFNFNIIFKLKVEKSKNSYEEILDKTTKSIEKFVKNTETELEKNIQ